ncbi:META domain-containing protein [Microbacterium oxydans]|uniref:META domain protein n=1 Tax=Microbacterium oxydans TaxID=82380 RepID=A0A0F0LCJ6_9MICO|nr:META domain-containing protein [Microbacterium oxydans]KJL29261.1 META domain protein [Microbacterium oxydans]
MLPETTRPSRPDDVDTRPPGLAIGLWVLIPVMLFFIFWVQLFESFSAVGCEGDCDLDLSLGARAVYPWAVGGSIAVAIITAVVLRMRRRPTHWGPLVGIILILVSRIATSVAFEVGLAGMYERNNRIANGEEPAETPQPLPDPVGEWEASVDGTPFLQFSADGTVAGSDGCNDLSGRWTQDSAGRIDLGTLAPLTTNVCEGIDSWLSRGRSADIIEGYMYVNGEAGSAIGGLQPAR